MLSKLNNKINILFVIHQIEMMGGSERLVVTLSSKLDRNIFNPSIAWFYSDKILKEFSQLEIPLYYIPKVIRFDFSTMQMLGKTIKDNNIHIVNAHHFMPMVYSFYGCKIKNSCRLIYTEHAESEVDNIPWKWRKIGGYLLNHSDGVIGVTSKVSEAINHKFKLPASNVFTIKNGIDLKAYTGTNNKKELRKQLGIPEGEKVIGIVANLKRVKNHIFLLKAFDDLIKKYNKVNLLIIGQGFKDDTENTETELRSFVNKRGSNKRVLFLGYREDIPDLLNIMDIFCLTSFNEGLPISLIEAMAAGLPIVGTDVKGIKDIVIPKKNGFLVRINDTEGLKNVLHMLLQDDSLREKFGQQSRVFAEEYSIDECVNNYQNLFYSVINNELI